MSPVIHQSECSNVIGSKAKTRHALYKNLNRFSHLREMDLDSKSSVLMVILGESLSVIHPDLKSSPDIALSHEAPDIGHRTERRTNCDLP